MAARKSTEAPPQAVPKSDAPAPPALKPEEVLGALVQVGTSLDQVPGLVDVIPLLERIDAGDRRDEADIALARGTLDGLREKALAARGGAA